MSQDDQIAALEARVKSLTDQVGLLEAVVGTPGPAAWLQAASRLKEAGQYQLAVNAYLEVARLDPDNASALNGAGVLLGKHLGDLDGAEDCYDRAIAAQPGFHSPIYNLACTAVRRGDLQRGSNLLALAICANERYLQLADIDPVFEPFRTIPDIAPLLLDRNAAITHLLKLLRHSARS